MNTLLQVYLSNNKIGYGLEDIQRYLTTVGSPQLSESRGLLPSHELWYVQLAITTQICIQLDDLITQCCPMGPADKKLPQMRKPMPGRRLWLPLIFKAGSTPQKNFTLALPCTALLE